MENSKYSIIVGMCGYMPDAYYEADTLEDIRYSLADIRANLLPDYWREGITTPVKDIRSSDIFAGGVSYYMDGETYVEIFPNK